MSALKTPKTDKCWSGTGAMDQAELHTHTNTHTHTHTHTHTNMDQAESLNRIHVIDIQ